MKQLHREASPLEGNPKVGWDVPNWGKGAALSNHWIVAALMNGVNLEKRALFGCGQFLERDSEMETIHRPQFHQLVEEVPQFFKGFWVAHTACTLLSIGSGYFVRDNISYRLQILPIH